MNSNKSWILYGPKSTKKLAEWVHDDMQLEPILCPLDEGHRRGGKRLTDLSVTLPGSFVNSFVWTWQGDCLFQDDVLDSFRTHGLTGFEVKPCAARFKKDIGKEPPRLWELIVTGWAGMASADSGIKLLRRCEGCQHMAYSAFSDATKLINRNQWDGSDIFMVWPLPRFVFISDRAAQIIKNAFWQDVQIMALSDLKFNGGPFLSPALVVLHAK